jgi:uncharacterized protein (DUF1501 family)
MAPLVPAWAEGRLAVVNGVGSDDTSGSHFEAQDRMERGAGAHEAVTGGWIGRYLRAVAPRGATPLAAVAIAPTLPESLRGAAAASAIASRDEVALAPADGDTVRATAALRDLYANTVEPLARHGTDAIRLLERVASLARATYAPANGAAYPDDDFAAGLREVARLLKAEVGMRVACIDLDGWDTHFVQGAAEGLQAAQIGRLAAGLAAFNRDVAAYRDRVTVLVATEFGRRIYENSSGGTDHGRGFAAFALGGRVRGGRVYGEWPGLDREEGPEGPGGLRILVDYRSVLAELVERAGGLADARAVFPGLARRSIGFL